MLVVADGVAGPVRREMVQGVVVPERQHRIRALIRAKSSTARQDLIPVMIVERIHAIARKTRKGEAIGRALRSPTHPSADPAAAVGSAFHTDFSVKGPT